MSLDEYEIRRVLENVTSTQESVQGASKWIRQNKQDIHVITKVWLDIYKTAPDNLQTSLIYVMNDCVQNAKHDKDQVIPITFHPHIVNAISIASDDVKKPIKRCLDIFSQRSIYPEHVIKEMQDALDGNIDLGANIDTDDALNLDVDQFCRRLEHYNGACNSLDKARKILDSMNFDIEDDSRTKSRNGVIELEEETELMMGKLKKFIDSIESQYTRTLKIMQLNKKAVKYYENQCKDVNTVHDAYERFAKGIDSSRSMLETVLQTGVLPGSTPPDAPSPTPSEGDTMDDGDDMQMDDDEKPVSTNPESALIPSSAYNPFPTQNAPPNVYQPSTSSTNNNITVDPRKMRNSQSVNPTTAAFQQLPSLPKELANMLPNPQAFFQQPPPQIRQPFNGASNYQRVSVESQDSNQATPTTPESFERQSWRNSTDSSDFQQPNFTVQTPTTDMQNLQFSSPPPGYNPELPPPSQQNSRSFFSPNRGRGMPPRGGRFFHQQGNRPPFQNNGNRQWDNQQKFHGNYQPNEVQNRRRSSDYGNWQQDSKRVRHGDNRHS